jgi:FkbM family methyltransferase
MKKTIKTVVKNVIQSTTRVVGGTAAGRYLFAQVTANFRERVQQVSHGGVSLSFSTPNELNCYRADSFSTKEPETLEWIDAMPEGSVVWDVGANVGLYSCYAAKKRNCRVFAFEPSVFNLELLARNIFGNALVQNITIVPLPLSDTLAVNTLNMTSMEWGGALSSFGQSYGHDGKRMPKVFEFPTIGLTMVDAVELLKIPQPDYIKLDVDGIEHLILRSGMPILSRVKGVLIEINEKFADQYNGAAECLKNAGLVLVEKRQSLEVESNEEFRDSFNQIWCRPETV